MFKFLFVLICLLLGRYPSNLVAIANDVPNWLFDRFMFVGIVAGAGPGKHAEAIDEARHLSFNFAYKITPKTKTLK